MVCDNRQTRTRTQLGRYGTDVAIGESRFLSVCDFKRLGVAKRSPTTTFTLEACSSHRGQTRATELGKVAMLLCGCFEIVLLDRLSDCIGLFIPSVSATDRDASGLPVLQQASMPR